MKRARITGGAEEVAALLPSNYAVVGVEGNVTIIEGEDRAGWTLKDYVLPRLASALLFGAEVDPTAPPNNPALLREFVLNILPTLSEDGSWIAVERSPLTCPEVKGVFEEVVQDERYKAQSLSTISVDGLLVQVIEGEVRVEEIGP